MAIVWSGVSGRLKVGIDVWTDTAINSGTTSINVIVDYYIEVVNWTYNDNQTLNTDAGAVNFLNNKSSGVYLIHRRSYFQGISYSGGPTHSYSVSLSGAYDGSAPSVSRTYTMPARPAAAPNAPTAWADSVGSSSARIGANSNGDNGSGIVEWAIDISTSSGFGSYTRYAGTTTVTGLSPATTYYVRAYARNGVNWSAASSTISFTTGATVPSAPSAPSTSAVDEDSVTVSWSAPSNGGSAITGYEVQFATNSGFTANVETFSDSASPYTSNTRNPATTYYVRVRAINAVGNGAWSPAATFTTLTGTPTVITPAASEASSRGWAYAIIEALGVGASDRTITVEWSTTSNFASILHTVTLTPTGKSSNDRYTVQDTTKKLPNGTYYVRARVLNIGSGYLTPNSATRTYTVSHTPAVLASVPAAGSTIKYTASTSFSFQFSDPSTVDRMASYELDVENNADGSLVVDGAKTALAGVSNPQTHTVTVAVPSSAKGLTLRWRVRVWDRDDQPSAWSGYNLFTLSDPPIVSITSPGNASTVDNGAPTFAWTVSAPSGGTQASALVQVYDSLTNALVWSTTVTGTGTSVTPPVVILTNQKSYYVNVTVTDSKGLSTVATSTFTASYQAPASVQYSFDGSQADELGYVNIDWTGSDADALFTSWKVYRVNLSDPSATWELIYETGDQNVRSYHDYMLSAGNTYSYSVTQTAYRSGVVLESTVGYYRDSSGNQFAEDRFTAPELSHYWIVDQNNPDDSVLVPNVTSDDNTEEYESASFNIMGRGRHRDYGDRLGYTGSLTCQVRTPERPSTFRRKMERLRANQETYYLRTPFGKLFPIALGNLGWTPIAGTGTSEMGDMTIPYEEVS